MQFSFPIEPITFSIKFQALVSMTDKYCMICELTITDCLEISNPNVVSLSSRACFRPLSLTGESTPYLTFRILRKLHFVKRRK